MKAWRLRKFNSVNWLLLVLLLAGVAWLGRPQTTASAQVRGGVGTETLSSKPPFVIRNYGGKCLDFGPAPQVSGAPVFIYQCNGTSVQQVRIEEVSNQHDVILRAGNKVIGVRSRVINPLDMVTTTLSIAQTETETPLELQDDQHQDRGLSQRQIFVLDGDSIILKSDRNRVVQVQNARGANRTPLVLGRRNLEDAEFWTFTAADGSGKRPTNGFVRISQINNFDDNSGELRASQDFLNAVNNANAQPGTVIELDANVLIFLEDAVEIKEGVTIRGDRRGTRPGPLLRGGDDIIDGMLKIIGNDVRITGLRLKGPSRSLAEATPKVAGIFAYDQNLRTIIDHNEMLEWPHAAVHVSAGEEPAGCYSQDQYQRARVRNVRVARNFIHHSQRLAAGYGVLISRGGDPLIEGNTFLSNRHAISGDGRPSTGYSAQFNLVLVAAPDYGNGAQQDFDMHGRGATEEREYVGGIAGEYMEIIRNTFLGGNRENFLLRGTPCYLAVFNHNVTVGHPVLAVKNLGYQPKLTATGNQFNISNPTNRLGVGDFDGDGTQDLFLATGAAWYYAPAGKAEWRFINAQTDRINNLLFGDFDGDKRTDVFTQHGYQWDVSWGGVSKWEKLNVSGNILGNAVVGDFIGDERDDIFYADGHQWHASDAGIGPFTLLADSSYRVADLRFGDFNSDGKTDVFSVNSRNWQVSYGGSSYWQPLRLKQTDSVNNLTVADFNGDGRADVATFKPLVIASVTNSVWLISYSGTGEFITQRTYNAQTQVAAMGRFDGNASADLLLWHGNYLDISARGAGTPVRYSREDMR